MKYLAIDTSTDALSIATALEELDELKVTASITQVFQQQHGVTLIPEIQKMLQEQDWQASEIDEIIVGIGPGSYTGLRIGVTLAKMWGKSLNIKVSKVSSLALLASQVSLESANIIPIMDARRMSAYVNIYERHQGQLISQGPDIHVDWQSWLESLTDTIHSSQKVWVLVGRKIQAFVDIFKSLYPEIDVKVIDEDELYPQAAEVFRSDLKEAIDDMDTLTPNYAHATLAEREWAEKNDTKIANEEENERFIEHFS